PATFPVRVSSAGTVGVVIGRSEFTITRNVGSASAPLVGPARNLCAVTTVLIPVVLILCTSATKSINHFCHAGVHRFLSLTISTLGVGGNWKFAVVTRCPCRAGDPGSLSGTGC